MTIDVIPPIVAPHPPAIDRKRRLPLSAPFAWLGAGWRDLWIEPATSLLYGLGVAVLSALIVAGVVVLDWGHILFPVLAGFFVFGPALATGLYEKSRRIAAGEPLSLGTMLRPRHGTGPHILFVGTILLMLVMIWIRAAVLLYALFWGLKPFPGLDHIMETMLTDPMGWALIGVGTAVGGLFAALSFAISVFSIPMLLDRKLDAFTAMGLSMSLTWHNLAVALIWGAIVVALALVGVLTAFVGFIVIFPLLGHASWHAYVAVRDEEEEREKA